VQLRNATHPPRCTRCDAARASQQSTSEWPGDVAGLIVNGNAGAHPFAAPPLFVGGGEPYDYHAPYAQRPQQQRHAPGPAGADFGAVPAAGKKRAPAASRQRASVGGDLPAIGAHRRNASRLGKPRGDNHLEAVVDGRVRAPPLRPGARGKAHVFLDVRGKHEYVPEQVPGLGGLQPPSKSGAAAPHRKLTVITSAQAPPRTNGGGGSGGARSSALVPELDPGAVTPVRGNPLENTFPDSPGFFPGQVFGVPATPLADAVGRGPTRGPASPGPAPPARFREDDSDVPAAVAAAGPVYAALMNGGDEPYDYHNPPPGEEPGAYGTWMQSDEWGPAGGLTQQQQQQQQRYGAPHGPPAISPPPWAEAPRRDGGSGSWDGGGGGWGGDEPPRRGRRGPPPRRLPSPGLPAMSPQEAYRRELDEQVRLKQARKAAEAAALREIEAREEARLRHAAAGAGPMDHAGATHFEGRMHAEPWAPPGGAGNLGAPPPGMPGAWQPSHGPPQQPQGTWRTPSGLPGPPPASGGPGGPPGMTGRLFPHAWGGPPTAGPHAWGGPPMAGPHETATFGMPPHGAPPQHLPAQPPPPLYAQQPMQTMHSVGPSDRGTLPPVGAPGMPLTVPHGGSSGASALAGPLAHPHQPSLSGHQSPGGFMHALSELRPGPSESQRDQANKQREEWKRDLEEQVRQNKERKAREKADAAAAAAKEEAEMRAYQEQVAREQETARLAERERAHQEAAQIAEEVELKADKSRAPRRATTDAGEGLPAPAAGARRRGNKYIIEADWLDDLAREKQAPTAGTALPSAPRPGASPQPDPAADTPAMRHPRASASSVEPRRSPSPSGPSAPPGGQLSRGRRHTTDSIDADMAAVVHELQAEQTRLHQQLEQQAALVQQLQLGGSGGGGRTFTRVGADGDAGVGETEGSSMFLVSTHLVPRDVNTIPSRLHTPIEAEWVGGGGNRCGATQRRGPGAGVKLPPLAPSSGARQAWPAIEEEGAQESTIGGGNSRLLPSGERSYYDEMPPEEQQFLDMMDELLAQQPDGADADAGLYRPISRLPGPRSRIPGAPTRDGKAVPHASAHAMRADQRPIRSFYGTAASPPRRASAAAGPTRRHQRMGRPRSPPILLANAPAGGAPRDGSMAGGAQPSRFGRAAARSAGPAPAAASRKPWGVRKGPEKARNARGAVAVSAPMQSAQPMGGESNLGRVTALTAPPPASPPPRLASSVARRAVAEFNHVDSEGSIGGMGTNESVAALVKTQQQQAV